MANTDLNTTPQKIDSIDIVQGKIAIVRGVQVILDRELAKLYNVEVGYMNRQVKRNIARFPDDFMFQLTKEEAESLKCQNGISNTRGGDRALPYAFTEQGVSMLSGILRSDTAIKANILIMRAFVAMRRLMFTNAQLFQRLDRLEYQQIENTRQIEHLFAKFEETSLNKKPMVFFDGQIFDAYECICTLIRRAKSRIVLIDNYIDDTVLTMLDKRLKDVTATIFTKTISKQLNLDVAKHNSQYPLIEVQLFSKSHDRFLIIDNQVYLIGASLKDLGKKWFCIVPMTETNAEELITRLIA